MYGLGILKSFSVTMKHFLLTYVDDIRYLGKRYRPENIPARQSPKGKGIFTVQYPRERLPLTENFRMFPFQVVDPETGIKMDHDYELADYKRSFLWDMDRLSKPLAHHAEIHPTAYAAEQAAQKKKAAKKK
ncbi:MAG: hypothetical protein B6I34_11445 [Anaerolineaceae bacterium 4572_32.1]|nr:MAG: hypothetical protein B6I34_11445 [Anaerolineaceae bacterium 4572_32.1]